MAKKENLSGVRFVRINGRVVPIRRKGVMSSETVKGSKGRRMVAQQRKNAPKQRDKARKLAFGSGLAYGTGMLGLGTAVTEDIKRRTGKGRFSQRSIKKIAGVGLGSMAASIGLLVGSSIVRDKADNFRAADQGLKGAAKNAGDSIVDFGLMAAGAAVPIVGARKLGKLSRARKAARSRGATKVVNKYDIFTKRKARKAKPARRPISGYLGGK